MDNGKNVDFKDYLSKLSPVDKIYDELEKEKLLENAVSFISLSDSTDSAIHLANVATKLCNKGYNVCIIDADVFYPSVYKILDCESKEKGSGLLKLIKSDKSDFKEELIEVKKFKNLYVLSSSPFDNMEDYFDVAEIDVARVFLIAKEIFDIVLINVPNNPPLEFCYLSIKASNLGFVFWGERIDAAQNTRKFFKFINSIGITMANFGNVVLSNRTNISFDIGVINEMKFRLITELPFVDNIYQATLEGKIYLKESSIVDKRYNNGIQIIADIITA